MAVRPAWAAWQDAERAADLVVIGAGVGGCAAALAASSAGLRVILTEETDWIGGQLTAQVVPPDEHPWIEEFGCTRAYRRFRNGVRDYYRDHYPLTPEARERAQLNPGNGWVSRLCHEPRVGVAVLEQMLAPMISRGSLILLTRTRPIAAEVDGDRVRSVTCQHLDSGRRITLTAPLFADGTELGELLPLTGTEYRTGAESQAQTGEPHAGAEHRPDNQQAFTVCFACEHLPGEDHTIDRPAEYAFWRDYVPEMQPPWPGPLFGWTYPYPRTLEPRTLTFDPTLKAGGVSLWTYRRLLDPGNFEFGFLPSGVTLVNWPQNDYLLGTLIDVAEEEKQRRIAQAKELSRSLLYWMQTEAPRPDGGTGWPGLRLRADITGTTDGMAKTPYIREARRIESRFRVTELHIGTDPRMRETRKSKEDVRATPFQDSVGIGAYRIDLHPSTGGDNYIDLDTLPFQIPLGALIPKRVENLLACAKNIGTTHITNGAYRVHPCEWNIGESVGHLAAYCKDTGRLPHQVHGTASAMEEFQKRLVELGVELAWPSEPGAIRSL